MKLTSPLIKNILIAFLLGSLVTSAFFVRLDNFENSKSRTIDEIVYYSMAKQVVVNPLDYNTIPYGKELSRSGRPLPEYFFKPLFKHPPVFTFLVALSLKFFGPSLTSAGFVSIALSVLMIPLIYMLAYLIYDRKVALMSALLLWMDPVSIMCSQKVWMDTTISFFTLLAVLFFVLSLRSHRDIYFLLCGISIGLATLTKYTGILVLPGIILYALLYNKELFKNKAFILSLCVPFLMLLPWIYWNYAVYGLSAMFMQGDLHVGLSEFVFQLSGLVVLFIVILIALTKIIKKRNHSNIKINTEQLNHMSTNSGVERFTKNFSYVFLIFLFCVLGKSIWGGLQIDHLPRHSWQQGFFHYEPPTFYFGQLLEYSLIYLFAYVGLFLFRATQKTDAAILRITVLTILLFFIAWRSYQSRYILSVLPFLLIFAAAMISQSFEKVSQIKSFAIQKMFKFLLFLFILISILKTSYVNILVSFPNNFCYF